MKRCFLVGLLAIAQRHSPAYQMFITLQTKRVQIQSSSKSSSFPRVPVRYFSCSLRKMLWKLRRSCWDSQPERQLRSSKRVTESERKRTYQYWIIWPSNVDLPNLRARSAPSGLSLISSILHRLLHELLREILYEILQMRCRRSLARSLAPFHRGSTRKFSDYAILANFMQCLTSKFERSKSMVVIYYSSILVEDTCKWRAFLFQRLHFEDE